MPVNWELPASEVSFQGVPKWQAENIEQLARKARENAKKQFTAFGKITPAEREKIDKEIKKLISHKARHAPEAKYWLSVTGRSTPIPFTEEDLKRAASDKNFARKIYNATTSAFSNADVVDFQNRIREEYSSVAGRSKKTQTKFPVDKIFEKKLGIDNNFDNKKFRKDSSSSSDDDNDDNQGGKKLLNNFRFKGNVKNKQIDENDPELQAALQKSQQEYFNRETGSVGKEADPRFLALSPDEQLREMEEYAKTLKPWPYNEEEEEKKRLAFEEENRKAPKDAYEKYVLRSAGKDYDRPLSYYLKGVPPYDMAEIKRAKKERDDDQIEINEAKNIIKANIERNNKAQNSETEGQHNKRLQENAQKAIEFETQAEDLENIRERKPSVSSDLQEIYNLEKNEPSREQLLERELNETRQELEHNKNFISEHLYNVSKQLRDAGISDDESEGNNTSRSNFSKKSSKSRIIPKELIETVRDNIDLNLDKNTPEGRQKIKEAVKSFMKGDLEKEKFEAEKLKTERNMLLNEESDEDLENNLINKSDVLSSQGMLGNRTSGNAVEEIFPQDRERLEKLAAENEKEKLEKERKNKILEYEKQFENGNEYNKIIKDYINIENRLTQKKNDLKEGKATKQEVEDLEKNLDLFKNANRSRLLFLKKGIDEYNNLYKDQNDKEYKKILKINNDLKEGKISEKEANNLHSKIDRTNKIDLLRNINLEKFNASKEYPVIPRIDLSKSQESQPKNFSDIDPRLLQVENELKVKKAEASIVEEAFKADPTNQELSAKYDLANKEIKNLEAQLNSDKLLGGTNPQEPLPDLSSIKQNMASMKAFNEKAEAQGFPADTTTNPIVKNTLEYNQKRATEAYNFMKQKQEQEALEQEREPSVRSVKDVAQELIENYEENPALKLLAEEREQAPQVMINPANKKEFVLPAFKTMHPSIVPVPLGQARLEASKIKRKALGLEETNQIDPEFGASMVVQPGVSGWASQVKQTASQYADYLDNKKKEELSNNIPKIEQNENQQIPQQNNQLNEEILENIPEDFEEYAENYDQNNFNISNQQNIPNIPNVPKNPPFGLLYHAGLGNKLKALNKESARLAPNNEIHEQVRRMAERNLDDDTLNLARKEIESSKKHNIYKEVKPFIDQTQDPLAFMDQYRNRYQKNVIDALRDEAKESFLEDELPGINNQYIMNGAFHGGARLAAIERARRDKERHLHREIAKLLSHGEENAAQKSFQHKKHLLNAAEISANAAKAQQEAGIRNSEAYRVNAAQKQISNQANIDNMQKIADQERTHEQNVINAQIADYETEKNYDWDQLQKESEVVRGLPSPGKVGYQGANQGQPMPVNPYNTAIAALGMIGAPKAPGQFAKGGHVKVHDKSKNLQAKINKSKFLYNKVFNKFASGGGVNASMNRWKQIQQHVEEQPEDQDMRRIANQFENHQIDPRQSLANQVIASHLGNLTGSPSENAGKAWAAHNATMEKDVDRKLESKERAANLYGKIKDSRINQGKVLGEFYGQEETRAQSDRHHGQTLGESRRQFEVGQANRKEELAEQARQRKIAETYTQKEHEQKATEFQANIAKRAGEIYKDLYPIASKTGYKSQETLSMITNSLLKGQNPYLLFKQENDTPKKTKQQAALEELKRRGDI